MSTNRLIKICVYVIYIYIFIHIYIFIWGFPSGASGKEPACPCRRHGRHRFNPCVGKIPWSRKWKPVSVFLPEKFHGQRSLAGYSPWDHKELDMTE